ncbi:hypothetical protein QYF61_027248 [Mycteria americana]|uniref:Uncharacterized protein n=1 Tax=Mycteria americana TaxID=33587 RepID=A0AAN7S199_MYCAM|nr:hypothetical protein QYF61_027248 [Mycteria americana]
MLHYEGGEALEQVAQRSCGCPVPGSVQGQVGWGFEQAGLVEGWPQFTLHILTSMIHFFIRSDPVQCFSWDLLKGFVGWSQERVLAFTFQQAVEVRSSHSSLQRNEERQLAALAPPSLADEGMMAASSGVGDHCIEMSSKATKGIAQGQGQIHQETFPNSIIPARGSAGARLGYRLGKTKSSLDSSLGSDL